MRILATPLSTPASSPCGTKYLSYSNIFFANFKEEQERVLAEKLKHQQQQQSTRIRTNTRLCRETAINNNNDYISSPESQESSLDNGNVKINETANILYEHNSDILDNIEEEEECSLKKHTINGTLYTTASINGASSSQSKKIRITENPLPEPVSC